MISVKCLFLMIQYKRKLTCIKIACDMPVKGMLKHEDSWSVKESALHADTRGLSQFMGGTAGPRKRLLRFVKKNLVI